MHHRAGQKLERLRSLSFARDEISVSKPEPLTRTRPFGRMQTFQLDRRSTRAQQASHSHAEPVVRIHLLPAASHTNPIIPTNPDPNTADLKRWPSETTDLTKRVLIRRVEVPGNASATGRLAACPGAQMQPELDLVGLPGRKSGRNNRPPFQRVDERQRIAGGLRGTGRGMRPRDKPRCPPVRCGPPPSGAPTGLGWSAEPARASPPQAHGKREAGAVRPPLGRC